jgi:hypothetical protein
MCDNYGQQLSFESRLSHWEINKANQIFFMVVQLNVTIPCSKVHFE